MLAPFFTSLSYMHRGIIILEGPDASGKTTLASQIEDEAATDKNWRYSKIRRTHLRERHNLAPFQFLATSKALAHRGLTIIDRHWISEEVYSAVYRPNSTRSTIYSRLWFEMFMSVPTVYVMCCPSVASAVESHRRTVESGISQLYEPDDRLKHVAELYRRIVGFHAYDFDNVNFFSRSLGHRLSQRGGLSSMRTMFPSQYDVVHHDIFEHPVSALDVLDTLDALIHRRAKQSTTDRIEMFNQRKLMMRMLQ